MRRVFALFTAGVSAVAGCQTVGPGGSGGEVTQVIAVPMQPMPQQPADPVAVAPPAGGFYHAAPAPANPGVLRAAGQEAPRAPSSVAQANYAQPLPPEPGAPRAAPPEVTVELCRQVIDLKRRMQELIDKGEARSEAEDQRVIELCRQVIDLKQRLQDAMDKGETRNETRDEQIAKLQSEIEVLRQDLSAQAEAHRKVAAAQKKAMDDQKKVIETLRASQKTVLTKVNRLSAVVKEERDQDVKTAPPPEDDR